MVGRRAAAALARPLLLLGCLLLLRAAGASGAARSGTQTAVEQAPEEANFDVADDDDVGEAGGKGRRGGGGLMATTGSFSIASNRAGNSEDDLGEAFEDITTQMNIQGGGAQRALLRQQLDEKKSKVAELEKQLSKVAFHSDGANPGRQLLGAAAKPLRFECDGDLAAALTSHDLPMPKPGRPKKSRARRSGNRGGNSEDTRDSEDVQVFTLERTLEHSEENLLQAGGGWAVQKARERAVKATLKAKESVGKASHKRIERRNKLRHKQIVRRDKLRHQKIVARNKAKGRLKARQEKLKKARNKAKARRTESCNKKPLCVKMRAMGNQMKGRVCKGPGCSPCTTKMCYGRYSCGFVGCGPKHLPQTMLKPKFCIRGVGCVTAVYSEGVQSVNTAYEYLKIGDRKMRISPLGYMGYGMHPQQNAMFPSANKKCYAKLSFRRITSRAPTTLLKRLKGRLSTMDITAHILEASLCNAKTKKCVFKKALLSCYKWAVGTGENRCNNAEAFAVVQ